MNLHYLKSIFSFFLFLFLGNTSFAQSEKFDYNGHSIEISKKVIEHFGSDYIADIKVNNKDHLLYLNYFSENSYIIEDLGIKASNSEIKEISSLNKTEKSKATAFNPSDISSFNILAYQIQPLSEQQVFKIVNSSKAIVVLPKSRFLEKFNTYRNALLK